MGGIIVGQIFFRSDVHLGKDTFDKHHKENAIYLEFLQKKSGKSCGKMATENAIMID
jgi:hypothetical protein